jgi:hypothetical protein
MCTENQHLGLWDSSFRSNKDTTVYTRLIFASIVQLGKGRFLAENGGWFFWPVLCLMERCWRQLKAGKAIFLFRC